MKTTKCPNGCNHTNAEHAAFDAGLAAGNKGLPETACKLRGALREDWLSGHSVGLENFKATPAPASGNAIFPLTMEKAAKIMGLDIGKNADRAAKLASVKPVCNAELDEPQPRHPMTGLTFAEIDDQNAELTAANSELIAALATLVSLHDHPLTPATHAHAIEQARAVIAKARP